jgi:S-adenosylmethionine:tRNA ribosyltransferase-isomerase
MVGQIKLFSLPMNLQFLLYITNFTKSTLLMMVSAFCGHDLMKRAYEEGRKEGYKFYSCDAMLII